MDAAAGVAETDDNDWRVTVRLHESGQHGRAVEHLSTHTVEGEAYKRLGGRVVVGTDGHDSLFLYTHSQEAAATARESVSELLAGHGMEADYTVQRWHPVEEEWEAANVAMPETPSQVEAERERLDTDETKESLGAGHALFEVRVQLPSHHAAVTLAGRLQAEGYSVARRWRFVVAGANNADQAEEFGAKIRQEAPAGSAVSIEEVGGLYPYSFIDMAAGAGL